MSNRNPLDRIFLIGMPGSGKSTVGKALAQVLNWDFFDTDTQIRAKTGVDIPTIFELEGEQGFRRREAEVISQMAEIKHAVIATGGGSILAQENRDCMSACGMVVYLTTPMTTLLRRVKQDKSRPLLATGAIEKNLAQMFERRAPLYKAICNMEVATGNRPARQIALDIQKGIWPEGGPSAGQCSIIATSGA